MREPAFPITAFPSAALPPTGQPATAGQTATGQLATAGEAGWREADWRELSACRQEDPDLFFPLVAAGPGLVQIERAKAVCARCPVRAECLRFAMETAQDHGVWGGASEDERRALRRARNRRPAAAGAGRSDWESDRMAPVRAGDRQRNLPAALASRQRQLSGSARAASRPRQS
jgi:WhiB family transcriptional regulator, redox-sensing transcriptional regulator